MSFPAPSLPWAPGSRAGRWARRWWAARPPSAGAAVVASKESRPSARTGAAPSSTGTTAPSPATSWSERRRSCACPKGSPPARRRWPNRLAVALHGITRSGVAEGDSVMVIGAGPIGALSIAALVARGIGPIYAVEPGQRRQQLAADLGATEVLDPADLETFPPGSRSASPPGPPTWSSSARARRRPWRPDSSRCAGAAPWPWWARASSTRRSIPTGSSSTRSPWSAPSSTTRAGSSRLWPCWPP